ILTVREILVMKKIISLCRNYEFQRLYRRGKSAVRPTLVMYAIDTKGDKIRLGITAGKKIGGAVCRNRAKRRIRELFRITQDELKCGKDICIVARGRILDVTYEKLVKDFRSAAEELELFAN
ncbi:MAG: ribonuclease P protein component, partial [Clostridia bacterium]|nr:ribonuclease P protein component [Clostridia bacterium]